MTWMRETRIKIFMQIELEAYRGALNWLLRCHDCVVNIAEEEYPSMPLPIPSGYAKNLARRVEMGEKGKLSPNFNVVLKKSYLPTTSTSVARSAASVNFVMLAIAAV